MSTRRGRTYGLFLLTHFLPHFGDHVQQLGVGKGRMLLLELLTDLILEKDIRRGRALRRVRILRFGIPFAFFGTLVLVERAGGLAFVLHTVRISTK